MMTATKAVFLLFSLLFIFVQVSFSLAPATYSAPTPTPFITDVAIVSVYFNSSTPLECPPDFYPLNGFFLDISDTKTILCTKNSTKGDASGKFVTDIVLLQDGYYWYDCPVG